MQFRFQRQSGDAIQSKHQCIITPTDDIGLDFDLQNNVSCAGKSIKCIWIKPMTIQESSPLPSRFSPSGKKSKIEKYTVSILYYILFISAEYSFNIMNLEYRIFLACAVCGKSKQIKTFTFLWHLASVQLICLKINAIFSSLSCLWLLLELLMFLYTFFVAVIFCVLIKVI